MGWWSRLFGPKGPKPIDQVVDQDFGSLVWSKEDESWIGEYGGYRIAIGYSGSVTPAPELLDYVRVFLGPGGETFTQKLADARSLHAHEFERWAEEYDKLKVETLRLGMSKHGFGCLVDFLGGEPDRSWRLEFNGMRCEGFGFDT